MLQSRKTFMKVNVLGDGYKSSMDVAYGSYDLNKVDIFWPEDATLMPASGWTAVIILPGLGSTKETYKGFCTKYIVPSGRLCVAGDYRMDDNYRDDDVYELATWFYSNAGKWDVNPASIVLGGCSQGGLTINNVIWDGKKGKDLLGGSPPKMRAVMLLSGTWENHKRDARKADYFPLSTYICSSPTDNTVPYKGSKDLFKELEKMDQTAKFVSIEDGGHSIWFSDKKDEWYEEILLYLDETVP